MKVVILAGGFGTRISEESQFKPKPMIEIGGMPIIWHIMKEFSCFGLNDFIICAGYKQEEIKKWFANYSIIRNTITINYFKNSIEYHDKNIEPWNVTIVDTGLETQTGGRIKRIAPFLDEEDFILTYGDGVADIDVSELINFHKSHGKLATISVYNFGQNKGVLEIVGNSVKTFREKSNLDDSLINIGFMVLNRKVLDFIDNDASVLEQEPMQRLISLGELMSYRHKGFWQCMDTLREKEKLEHLWSTNQAPWKKW